MKTFYVGIKGLIVRDGEVLLLRKAGGDFWEVPGGRIDGNETIEETLKRELQEELPNIKDVKIGDILGAHRVHKNIDSDISLTLIYYMVNADFDGEPQISDEHDEWKWVSKKEALDLMSDKAHLFEYAFTKL